MNDDNMLVLCMYRITYYDRDRRQYETIDDAVMVSVWSFDQILYAFEKRVAELAETWPYPCGTKPTTWRLTSYLPEPMNLLHS